MVFVQVSYTITSFTWWIVRTMIILISITFVFCLIPKQCSCFFRTTFSTSGIVSSFVIFLGLTGSWIWYFLMIKLSEVLFILFLQGISYWSGFTTNIFSPCPEKTERLELSLQISIYVGFYILLILLYKLVLGIYLDLFNVFNEFYVSVIWVDPDLSNDLKLSYLLLLDVSTVLLDASDFSFFLTV